MAVEGVYDSIFEDRRNIPGSLFDTSDCCGADVSDIAEFLLC